MNKPLWHQFEFWATFTAILVLMLGHYLTNPEMHFWHDLFRRLSYLPIITAGFRYGWKGGILSAGVIITLFLPHVFLTRATLVHQAREAVFEIPLYLTVGAITGILADRQRRMQEELYHGERLKTLGEMAAVMAHEVKNPLAVIRSSVQILAGRVSDKETELTTLVITEVDRLNRLIEDFLQYARPAPLRLQLVAVEELLGSALKFLEPVIGEKNIRVEKLSPKKGLKILADPNQLRQVFLNLLLNATQAVKPGGEIKVGFEATGNSVRVFISDNGPGIPQDKLKFVFEPFWTTKTRGTGLGLAIAQRIVNEHGGRLILKSEVGKGTTAWVILKKR